MTAGQDDDEADVRTIMRVAIEEVADARAAEMARQLWAIWFMQDAVTALLFVAGTRWWLS